MATRKKSPRRHCTWRECRPLCEWSRKVVSWSSDAWPYHLECGHTAYAIVTLMNGSPLPSPKSLHCYDCAMERWRQGYGRIEWWHFAAGSDAGSLLVICDEEQQQLKKECKTKTLIRLEGEALEDYWAYRVEWPTDTWGQLSIMAELTKQLHHKVITEFVNKRFA